MKQKVLNGLLIVVFLIGIIGSGVLVYNELKSSEGCPILVGIPACYIIFACFLIPFTFHLNSKKNAIYFLFTGLAFTIALIASVMQLLGKVECPKTDSGTPMCYYSLVLFTSLIGLKWAIIQNKAKNSSIAS